MSLDLKTHKLIDCWSILWSKTSIIPSSIFSLHCNLAFPILVFAIISLPITMTRRSLVPFIIAYRTSTDCIGNFANSILPKSPHSPRNHRCVREPCVTTKSLSNVAMPQGCSSILMSWCWSMIFSFPMRIPPVNWTINKSNVVFMLVMLSPVMRNGHTVSRNPMENSSKAPDLSSALHPDAFDFSHRKKSLISMVSRWVIRFLLNWRAVKRTLCWEIVWMSSSLQCCSKICSSAQGFLLDLFRCVIFFR